VLDGAILAPRIHCLQHDEQRLLAFREKFFLQEGHLTFQRVFFGLRLFFVVTAFIGRVIILEPCAAANFGDQALFRH
jgi:hypothetical protein